MVTTWLHLAGMLVLSDKRCVESVSSTLDSASHSLITMQVIHPTLRTDQSIETIHAAFFAMHQIITDDQLFGFVNTFAVTCARNTPNEDGVVDNFE